ncbi:hypothetical protein [Tropheryma whipplei]|nr:hypothetical protein [Tropheryma whipplei]
MIPFEGSVFRLRSGLGQCRLCSSFCLDLGVLWHAGLRVIDTGFL